MMRSYNSKIIPVYRKLSDKMYIEDIESVSPSVYFTDEQIRQLIREYKKTNNEKLFKILIHSFSKYVISIAKNYQEQGLTLGDLISEGMLGLITAIINFDLQNKTKFVTYSNIVISRYMREALDYFNNVVKLPKNIRNNRMKTREIISVGHMQGLSEDEIIDKVDKENLIFFYNPEVFGKKSLSDTIQRDSTTTVEDLLQSESDFPDTQLNIVDLQNDIKNILNKKLTRDEIDVIVLYFGIGLTYSITSVMDLGKRLGFTKDEINILKESAIQKLREADCIEILSKYI